MRLGLFSTMAALLAGTGLALGQAPAPAARGQLVDASRTVGQRQVLPVSTEMVAQAPAPAPAPAPVLPPSTPTPLVATDLVGPPVEGGVGGAAPADLQLYRTWFSAEALVWRFGGSLLPSLTASVPAGTITASAAQVTTNGATTTQTIINRTFASEVNVNVVPPGGSNVLFNDQPGMRLALGFWLDPQQETGIDLGYFWMWRRTVGFNNVTNIPGQTINSGLNQQLTVIAATGTGTTATVVATEPVFIAANTNTSLFGFTQNRIWGAEVNSRGRYAYFGPATVDIFGGFRYIDIAQTIGAVQSISLTPFGAGQTPPPDASSFFSGVATIPPPGLTTTLLDSVYAHNQIWGIQFGGSIEWFLSPRIFMTGVGKLGFGDNYMTFQLTGSSTGTSTPTSGMLVSNGDNGTTQHSHRFIFYPELNLYLGFQITDALRIFGGYNVIYLSAVAKVANQVATTTQTTTVTFGNQSTNSPTVIPGFRASTDDASLQGFNLGLEYRY